MGAYTLRGFGSFERGGLAGRDIPKSGFLVGVTEGKREKHRHSQRSRVGDAKRKKGNGIWQKKGLKVMKES